MNERVGVLYTYPENEMTNWELDAPPLVSIKD